MDAFRNSLDSKVTSKSDRKKPPPISAFNNSYWFKLIRVTVVKWKKTRSLRFCLRNSIIDCSSWLVHNHINNTTWAFHPFITCMSLINSTVADIALLKYCAEKHSHSASRFERNHGGRCQSTAQCGRSFVRRVRWRGVPQPSVSDSLAALQTAKLNKDNHVQW